MDFPNNVFHEILGVYYWNPLGLKNPIGFLGFWEIPII